MSTELIDEHEQGERVRAWLRENGGAIIGGVVLGLALLFGWQWWQQSQQEARLTAATQYQALRDAVERNDRDAVEALAASLTGEFGGTAYATWALLELADQQRAAGELATAQQTLERAIAEAEGPLLADLARVRLARLLLAGGDAEGVLQRLGQVAPGTYVAVVAELRGDALRSLGRTDEARDAYALAMAELQPTSPARRLVEMKLIDAGGTPPALES